MTWRDRFLGLTQLVLVLTLFAVADNWIADANNWIAGVIS